MSDIKHKIGFGANTPVDIDGALQSPSVLSFTADSTLIFADSTIRTADETNI